MHIYIYIYVFYTHIYLASSQRPPASSAAPASGACRRRLNMVGVNMVLAEFVKFKHGLYKSCGMECFEGIMLEPCLLQPCVHVAGPGGTGRRKRGRQKTGHFSTTATTATTTTTTNNNNNNNDNAHNKNTYEQ